MAKLCTVLAAVASLYCRVYIVIDALDESTYDERDMLLKAGSDLQREMQVSILETSRPEIRSQFTEHFKAYEAKEIRALGDDIRNYVDDRLEHTPRRRLSKLCGLKDRVKDKLVDAAEGM